MDLDLEEYHRDLMQEVRATATAEGLFMREAFVDVVAGMLLEAEELQDWTTCYFEGSSARGKGFQIDGHCADELGLDGTVHVLIAEFDPGDAVATLSTTAAKAAHSRGITMVAESVAGRLHDVIEPSHPAADFAQHLHAGRDALRTLKVHLLTNAAVSARYKAVDRSVPGIPKVETHVWDIARLQKMAGTGGREEIAIDITRSLPDGLPALPAGLHSSEYAAYLCVVPGTLLAAIYEEYGSRILEGNVRAFLSARGKINKGIRKTIRSEPERFFAYNNGITATASQVDLSSDGAITTIRDLQIVNGGQTTASLYNTRELDGASLDNIFVQMKLSVVPPETARAMIPEISRYANTQNKVAEADLFANHPFNLEVERLSRSTWAPGKDGSPIQTRWFYERARAQYQSEQMKLSAAEKRKFILENPKPQVISKTDLAKIENTWRLAPHVVSLGAQKNFVRYAEHIGPVFDTRPHEFNELWFKGLVARAIVHQQTGRLVSNASWYSGSYRANIVTYAIARTLLVIEEAFPDKTLDLEWIWKHQCIHEALEEQLLLASRAALDALLDSPTQGANITEWAKKEACWDKLKSMSVPAASRLDVVLRDRESEKHAKQQAGKSAKATHLLNGVIEVIRLRDAGFWQRAADSPEAQRVLTPKELGILRTLVSKPKTWVPTDAQAVCLLDAYDKLRQEGLA